LLSFVCILYIVFACLFKLFVCIFNFSLPLVVNKDVQYCGRLGEFNGMSSHSHVSHRRVLPLGEFTVTIPEPHATLQGAVT